jgi:hypothetical protein
MAAEEATWLIIEIALILEFAYCSLSFRALLPSFNSNHKWKATSQRTVFAVTVFRTGRSMGDTTSESTWQPCGLSNNGGLSLISLGLMIVRMRQSLALSSDSVSPTVARRENAFVKTQHGQRLFALLNFPSTAVGCNFARAVFPLCLRCCRWALVAKFCSAVIHCVGEKVPKLNMMHGYRVFWYRSIHCLSTSLVVVWSTRELHVPESHKENANESL